MLLTEARRAARADGGRRARPPGGAGPVAVGPGPGRGGRRAAGRRPRARAGRAVPAAGRHRRRPRRGAQLRTRPTGSRSLGLYRLLERVAPSPVVALNRAVALAMVEGPDAGLAALAPLDGRPPGWRGTTASTRCGRTCWRRGATGAGRRRLPGGGAAHRQHPRAPVPPRAGRPARAGAGPDSRRRPGVSRGRRSGRPSSFLPAGRSNRGWRRLRLGARTSSTEEPP